MAKNGGARGRGVRFRSPRGFACKRKQRRAALCQIGDETIEGGFIPDEVRAPAASAMGASSASSSSAVWLAIVTKALLDLNDAAALPATQAFVDALSRRPADIPELTLRELHFQRRSRICRSRRLRDSRRRQDHAYQSCLHARFLDEGQRPAAIRGRARPGRSRTACGRLTCCGCGRASRRTGHR
jgi:hypothetical protein